MKQMSPLPDLARLTSPQPLGRRPRSLTGVTGVSNTMRDARLEYQASLGSRFKRKRSRLGGPANAHFATPQQYREVREYARDMARNDAIVGSLVRKAVDNIVRTGFMFDPQTGDLGLDAEIRGRFEEWAADKKLCDARGMHTFANLTRMALTAQFLDGDIFAVLTEDGQIQMMEGDWVTSPHNLNGNVFHGVELDPIGKPLRYWFLKDFPARFSHREMYAASSDQVTKIDAYDANGWPNVLHLFDPDRITQNRGMCAFHAVFDRLGMLEDADFARLVQQQIVSCFAMFLELDAAPQHGSRENNTQADGTRDTVEDIEAGTITRLNPGEKPHAFSPNVPNPEYFHFFRLQLRIIGACIGMPLELILYDTSDTTFHGYRGALQQAYIGFQCRQIDLCSQFNQEIYRWKLGSWAPDLGMAALRNKNLYRHRWDGYGFPYVDPKVDAEADSHRLEHMLVSPRRLSQERGLDWNDTVRETVEDRAQAIAAAMEAAKALSSGGEEIGWREVLNLAAPEGVEPPAPEPVAPAPAPGKPAAAAPSLASLVADPRKVRRLARAVAGDAAALAALAAGDAPAGFSAAESQLVLEALRHG